MKDKLIDLVTKVKTWWNSIDAKVRKPICIVSSCIAFAAVFFTIIYLVEAAQ